MTPVIVVRMKRFLLLTVTTGILAAQTLPPTSGDHLVAMAKLRQQGRLSEAYAEAEAALAIAQKLPQPDARLAVVFNSLASLEQDTARWYRAEIHYKQSLRVLDQLPFAGIRETRASTANNLGTLYTKMNRPDRAEPLLRQAILLRTQVLGEEHPDTIRSSMNLANLLQATGRLAEATLLLTQTVEYWTAHPQFKLERMIAANNLAIIALRQERCSEAASMLEQVLAGFEDLDGTLPLFKAKVQISLAHYYRLQHKFPRAGEQIAQALATIEKVLGVDHPDYAKALNESAQLLRNTGRKSLAGRQERQAQSIIERHDKDNFLGHTVDARTLAAAK